MQTKKSQPSGQRIMPQTRFIEFPALIVYPLVGISRSVAETDDRFYLSRIAAFLAVIELTFMQTVHVVLDCNLL